MSEVNNEMRLTELSKNPKFIAKAYLIHSIAAGSFTMERMMAPSMIAMLASIANDLYPNNPGKQADLLQRHNNFYNTQPNMAIVPGVVVGLEIERAKGNDVPNEIIQSMKAALAGPFAGIGDSLVQGMFVPILLSIGMGLSSNGSILGPLFVLVVYTLVMAPLSYTLMKLGIKLGVSGAEMLLDDKMKNRALNAVALLGCTVVGAVTASTCNLSLAWTIQVGELETSVQSYLDQIFPGLTILIAFGLIYWAMKYKKIGAVKMLGILLIVSAVGYFLGIL